MESLPSVQDYCKNGLFPSQARIGKKFCSSRPLQAAKFDLHGKSLRDDAIAKRALSVIRAEFGCVRFPLAESGHNDAILLKCLDKFA